MRDLDPTEPAASDAVTAPGQRPAMERLVEVAQALSLARKLEDIMAVVRHAGRELTGADGATFVLRDGDRCYYADEDAIRPLWKGHRFPMSTCISGWAMLNQQAVVIEDIFEDDRIPKSAYAPTFVKSLAVVPIRSTEPVGAIGNYWASRHRASEEEVKVLRALADLTSVAMENVQLYGALEQRAREAQDALRARDEFLSVAAHELRTPLTNLQLQLELMRTPRAREVVDDGAAIAFRASRALASLERLNSLVDDLVETARASDGPLSISRAETNMVELVAAVVERFRASADRAGCVLSLQLPDEPVIGQWDRSRIERVLGHLLSNAVKYGAGSPIEVRVASDERFVHLAVEDDGPGIPPELCDTIFERFRRAAPSTHYGGLGLGLYLAREIVRAHDGAIRFEGGTGGGATFVVELARSSSAG